MKLRTDKLLLAMAKKGLNQTELAKQLNVSKSQISRYKNGYDNPTAEKIKQLAEILDTTVEFLTGSKDDSIDINSVRNLIASMKLIPVLGKISAGLGINIPEDEKAIEYISIPSSIEGHFALIVQGNSMEPELKDGELAIIIKTDILENGEIGAICVNGDDGVIKKFLKTDDEIQLISLNTNYPAKIFRGSEMKKIRIIGKVVGKFSKIKS